jgi:hypothetical protein
MSNLNLELCNILLRVFWDVALSSHVEVDDVLEVRTASIIRAMNKPCAKG